MPYFHRELLPVSMLFLIIGIGATVFARAMAKQAAEFETTGSPALRPFFLIQNQADGEDILFKRIRRTGFVFLSIGCIAAFAMFFLEEGPVGR